MTTLALIGAGAIAQTYMQALDTIPDAGIGAVVDVNPQVRASAAERLNCAAYASLDELLEAQKPDGVIVTTPPAGHGAQVVACLEAGVPVLCEKPLTTGMREAQNVVSAANRTGTLLAMASKFRYVEDLVKARSLIDSGVVGQPLQVENLFAAQVDMSSRWNSDPAVSGGGVMIDNGTHSVEIIRYLAGPIRRVRALTETYDPDLGVEDTALLFVGTESGVRGHIELSWALSKKSPNWVTVYGTEGTIQIGWKDSRFKRNQDQDWTVFGKGYDKVDAFRRNIGEFLDAIAGRDAMRTTTDDALASVRVIEAAYASASLSCWADVKPDRPFTAPLTAIDGGMAIKALG